MNKSEALKKKLRTELAQELENTWEVPMMKFWRS